MTARAIFGGAALAYTFQHLLFGEFIICDRLADGIADYLGHPAIIERLRAGQVVFLVEVFFGKNDTHGLTIVGVTKPFEKFSMKKFGRIIVYLSPEYIK